MLDIISNKKEKENKDKNLIRRGLLITKTLLFRVLMRRANGIVNNPKRIYNLVDGAYGKFKKYDNTSQLTTDVVAGFYLFVDMLKSWVKGRYSGFENYKILYIIGAILYLISPLDIVPDAIPVLGFLDDLSILAWLYSTMKEEVDQYVTWRKLDLTHRSLEEHSFEELYAMAQATELKGRSTMTKKELIENLQKK